MSGLGVMTAEDWTCLGLISTSVQKGVLEEHANELDDKNQMSRTRNVNTQNILNCQIYYEGGAACLAIIVPGLLGGG